MVWLMQSESEIVGNWWEKREYVTEFELGDTRIETVDGISRENINKSTSSSSSNPATHLFYFSAILHCSLLFMENWINTIVTIYTKLSFKYKFVNLTMYLAGGERYLNIRRIIVMHYCFK